MDASGWSGDGELTKRLLAAMASLPAISSVKVEDAPASRADAGFSFISTELFVVFATVPAPNRGADARAIVARVRFFGRKGRVCVGVSPETKG